MPPRAASSAIFGGADPLTGRRASTWLTLANQINPAFGGASSWGHWAHALDPANERSAFFSIAAGPRYLRPSSAFSLLDFSREYAPPIYASFPTGRDTGITDIPLPRGLTDRPASLLFSTKEQFARDIEQWLRREHPELVLWQEGRLGNVGDVADFGPDDRIGANVDRWNDLILAAVRQVFQETNAEGFGIYVPPNLVKAIIYAESEGDPSVKSDAGAIGLMQVMPFWFNHFGVPASQRFDPYTNILTGVRVLAEKYKLGSPDDPNVKSWEWAARRYFGLVGQDSRGTTHQSYWTKVSMLWNKLNGAAPRQTPAMVEVGVAGPNTPRFEMFTPEINAEINAAARMYGVPANLIKAIIRIESGGAPFAGPLYFVPRRDYLVPYVGIYRSTALSHKLNWDAIATSRSGAIMELAKLLRIYADMPNVGGQYGWRGVASYFFSGNPDPSNAWSDELGTPTSGYLATVFSDWEALDRLAGVTSSRSVTATSRFKMIWGGFDAPISQPFGYSDWAAQQGMYRYTIQFTRDRSIIHGGVDVDVASWTPIFSPVAGTVVVSGGSGSYCDPGQLPQDPGHGCGPGVGELRIRIAGTMDEIIIGHMRQIDVKVGQTVKPGDHVGFSGNMNGPHIHVEYRRWVGPGVTNSGWELVDPADALEGVFVGSFGNVQKPILGQTPDDWRAYVRAAVEGRPLIGFGLGGFHDWVRRTIGVGVAPRLLESQEPQNWLLGYYRLPTS